MKRFHMFIIAAVVVAGVLPLFVACQKKNQVLHVFTWSDYFSDATIEKFEKTFKADVVLDTYENNEDLVAKLQTGATGYDIVVPSDYAVAQLIDLNLLEPLDKNKIENFQRLNSDLLNQYFDAENRHSIPYLWGSAGIAYDKTKVTSPPTSWAILWDEKYANQINMLDDMREAFAAAFKRLGYSVNEQDPARIEEAKNLLIQQKKLVRSYTTETDALMLSGQVALTHAWSGDVFRVAEENPNWDYVIPQEGSTFFIDNLAIPKGAPNLTLAHTFLNFILEPENIAAVTAFTRYANAVPDSAQFLPESLKNNPFIFPSKELLSRLEPLKKLGDETVAYGTAWTAVKSAP